MIYRLLLDFYFMGNNIDNTDDLVLLVNTTVPVEYLLHSQKQVKTDIGLNVNTECAWLKQNEAICI